MNHLDKLVAAAVVAALLTVAWKVESAPPGAASVGRYVISCVDSQYRVARCAIMDTTTGLIVRIVPLGDIR